MKRIKVALAALAGIIGIGGAYAVGSQNDASAYRSGAIYNWYTAGGTLIAQVTVGKAIDISGCPGGNMFCLRGTASGSAVITLFQPLR